MMEAVWAESTRWGVVLLVYVTAGLVTAGVLAGVLAVRNPSGEYPSWVFARWTFLVWPLWLIFLLWKRRSRRNDKSNSD